MCSRLLSLWTHSNIFKKSNDESKYNVNKGKFKDAENANGRKCRDREIEKRWHSFRQYVPIDVRVINCINYQLKHREY